MAPAGRMDLAIKCSISSNITWSVSPTYHNVWANLVIVPGTANNGTPFATTSGGTWAPVRPSYLKDLRTSTPSEQFVLALNTSYIRWNGNTANSGSIISWNVTQPVASLSYGSVYQLNISHIPSENSLVAPYHPFHLHVYPMQVIGVFLNGQILPRNCSGNYVVGQFYDTIFSSDNCVVRFYTSDYSGRVVLHCHHLAHEDNGVMTWFDVTDGPGLYAAPANPPIAAQPNPCST